MDTATSASAEPPRPHQRAVDPHKPSAGHRPLSALRGELDQIALSSVLTVLEMERKSGILMAEHVRGVGAGCSCAAAGSSAPAIDEPALSGAAAVYQMLTWGAGSFDFLAGDVGGVDEIQASTTYLLIEGARRLDEAKGRQAARGHAGRQDLTSCTVRPRPSTDVIERDIVVPAECGGWRLDHFLKRRIGRLSRTRIQSIIGDQIFFSDGRPARPSSPVRAGRDHPLRRPAPIEPEVPRHFDILFEDDSVLVIDKPAGLPMHTTAKFWRNTLVALLRERYPNEQMEIAHRIDRETSGVLLIARDREVASFLTRAFARRAVEKTYLALVKGHPPDEGRIDVPLRLLDTTSHVMMGPAPPTAGLPAVTRFRVVRRLPAPRARARRTRRPDGSTRSASTSQPSATPSWATSSTAPARRCSCAPATRG